MSAQSAIFNPTNTTSAATGDGFSVPRLTTTGRLAITFGTSSLRPSRPSVGPYWSAVASPSAAMPEVISSNRSGGKVEVSGSPPAREITSGRLAIDIMFLIEDERIWRVLEANRAAYRSRSRASVLGRRGAGGTCSGPIPLF